MTSPATPPEHLVQQQDSDGVWRTAIPLPFYAGKLTWRGWRQRFICGHCAEAFKTEQAYRDHYRPAHAEAGS